MPIFWALIASSNMAVVLPVLLWPRNSVICPIGAPGIEIDSCNALENGIHLCSLNLTFVFNNFFSLNLSKLKLAFISSDTAAVNDVDFSLLAIICFYLLEW